MRLGLEHTFQKRRGWWWGKRLTSKLDTSLNSPGNHKRTPLKTAESAISVPLSSFKETRMEEEEKRAEYETRSEYTLNERRHEGKNSWGMPNPTEVNGNFSSSFMELGLHP